MVFYESENLVIRTMKKEDSPYLVKAFAKQNWNKPLELFEQYYVEQQKNKRQIIIAEFNHHIAGYVTLLPFAKEGPFKDSYIPELVDFNVLIKYQRKGIGNKILDVAEQIASKTSEYIVLAVGLHSGYGSAQRIYVKRGYIPDGTGVWYKERPLEQYADCVNDDELVLYFSKLLNSEY